MGLAPQRDATRRQVAALWSLLRELHGPEHLVLLAAKVGALELMRSPDPSKQLTAILRMLREDPTASASLTPGQVQAVLRQLEDRVADHMARRELYDRVERRVAERLQKNQSQYYQEIRAQVLKEEAGPDNAQTLRKYAEIEQLEQRHLGPSLWTRLRPRALDEVVGQERAIRALVAKLASPVPQHVILYGPPGVGKTTVARLVLEYARQLPYTPFAPSAPFVEVDGATLRWDPREASNPLLGSVHDPIYQGARREFAEYGVPEPKTGLVTEAHGGVLFIDEIGELDPMLQGKLLKVLEDRRVHFDSSYYDPDDPRAPKYVRKLFEEGAPADFILLGATTRMPSEMNPALRSRCAEIFFDPLTPKEIRQVVEQAAARLDVALEDGVSALIAEHAPEARRATAILADAYGLALQERVPALAGGDAPGAPGIGPIRIGAAHVEDALRSARMLSPSRIMAAATPRVGRAMALGVFGYRGVVLEVEAIAFEARSPGQGELRFNETAGSMARDSVFVAASLTRSLLGLELKDHDVHVNVVGGGLIDGPSAGLALTTAVISALLDLPVRQDVAMTGEVSVWGEVKPVGGVLEKVWAARESGMKRVILPRASLVDLPPEMAGFAHGVERVDEALDISFGDGRWRKRA